MSVQFRKNVHSGGLPIELREQARKELREKLTELTLAEAILLMRNAAGMNQADYAEMVGISRNALVSAESAHGNPTVETLNKIFKPFGMEVGIRVRA